MRLLALYTASEPASVALLAEGRIDALELERGRTLERLAPAASELLRRAGLEPRALDGVAVASGPGSFTGLRVGAATALGLARAAGVPLHAAGTLDVWAAAASAEALRSGAAASPFWVVLDARRGEVYAARYERTGGRVRLSDGPGALPVAEAAARLAADGAPAIGDAAGVLAAHAAVRSLPAPRAPLAGALAQLVAADPAPSRRGPAAFRLDYLREPQAVARRAALAAGRAERT